MGVEVAGRALWNNLWLCQTVFRGPGILRDAAVVSCASAG